VPGVCPTEAIVFGDINGRELRVNRRKAEPRNYGLLAELTPAAARATSRRCADRTPGIPGPRRRRSRARARGPVPAGVFAPAGRERRSRRWRPGATKRLQEITERAERERPPVLGPGLDPGAHHRPISAIVLTPKTPARLAPESSGSRSSWSPSSSPPRASCSGRASASGAVDIPVAWGVAIVKLRVVDSAWPRRHADLGDPAPASPAVAHSINRFAENHDALRGAVRRHVRSPPGAPVALLLADPLPGHHAHLAPVPQPPRVGLFAVTDLPHVSLLFWYVA